MLIMSDGNSALHHATRMMSSLDEEESDRGCQVLFAATRAVPNGFDESIAMLALIRWLCRCGEVSETAAVEISHRTYEVARNCGRIEVECLSAIRQVAAIAYNRDPDVEQACDSFLRGQRLHLVD